MNPRIEAEMEVMTRINQEFFKRLHGLDVETEAKEIEVLLSAKDLCNAVISQIAQEESGVQG